jgi:hypothetical protein
MAQTHRVYDTMNLATRIVECVLIDRMCSLTNSISCVCHIEPSDAHARPSISQRGKKEERRRGGSGRGHRGGEAEGMGWERRLLMVERRRLLARLTLPFFLFRCG